MAQKFFNQKIKNQNKIAPGLIAVIIICIIFIIIAVLLIISLTKSNIPKDAKIKLRDAVTVEINTQLPDKTLFFTELENVKESDINISLDNVDLTKVGEYSVPIKLYNKKYSSKVIVIDTESPKLTLKDLTISEGDTYKADDFVEECTDNSKQKCNIEFYSLATDIDGNKIDYSTFKEKGTYTIQIIAKDNSENQSTPISAKLIIGNQSTSTSPIKKCKFGTDDYDKNKYILASNVTQDGCALDLNLYQQDSTLLQARTLLENEERKLKNELKTLNLSIKDIYLTSIIDPVINTTGNGLVGYTIHLELTINKDNNNKEIVASYYLKSDGSRIYSTNTYKLK